VTALDHDDYESSDATWMRTAEKGSVLGIRLLVWLATMAGRAPARLVLRIIALYYVALHGDVRRSSKTWLRRVLGREPTFADVYRHVLTFAQVTLDRLFFVQGKHRGFIFNHNGGQLLRDLAASGSGGILLSAHVGSQAAMSAEGRDKHLRINVAGYFANAEMINAVLRGLNPEINTRVVHIDPSNPGSVLAIRERVDNGEMVALAADRVGINERVEHATFFGAPAPFPVAPFTLALVLRKPVYLVFAFFHEPNRYELYCEPFADAIIAPRKRRQEALAEYIQQYASRLEHYCRDAPYNWFNFFDFWNPSQLDSDAAPPPPSTESAAATNVAPVEQTNA